MPTIGMVVVVFFFGKTPVNQTLKIDSDPKTLEPQIHNICWMCFFGDFLRILTMGFITIFHHHLGEYVVFELFPSV